MPQANVVGLAIFLLLMILFGLVIDSKCCKVSIFY